MFTPANSNTLAYTPANRLASASGAWGSNSFSYDAVGNRLTDVTPARTHTSTYGAANNRLSSITENAAAFRSYTYDGAGNTLTETRPGENLSYDYNNRNRLTAITRNGVSWASYGYNALEQLVSRSSSAPSAPSGTVHYLYDLDGHLIAEAEGATGTVLRDYIWLPSNDNLPQAELGGVVRSTEGVSDTVDLPLAVVEGVNTASPVTYQVHTDHLGRPVRMTDAAKATVWSAVWTPWGEAQSLTGSAVNNLRFPGQYFLIETGQAYNWHRSYDPVSGRYTQPDPLRFVDGPSLYAYAGNSPFMVTDREGQNNLLAAGILSVTTGYAGGFYAVGYSWWNWGDCLTASDYLKAFRLGARKGMVSGAMVGLGGGAGSIGLRFGLRGLSATTKGKIGEALSIGWNRLRGSKLIDRNTKYLGSRTEYDSVWQTRSGEIYYVESKFGKSTLTSAQRAALKSLGSTVYQVERWGYDFFGHVGAIVGGAIGGGGAAATEN